MTTTTGKPATGRRARSAIARFWPLAVLAAGFAAFFAFGLDDFVTFGALRENRDALLAFVERFGVLAHLAFAVVYAVAVAFSLPGGALMTVAGGFLFGLVGGGATVVVAATVGATALFLIARTTLGAALRARAGPFLQRMEAGFRDNALSYLLVLRLIPLFPFWLVNLVPAFLGVTTRVYVVATLVGIIPGTFVYASLGDGLGALIEAGGEPDLAIVFEPRILAPLVGLAVLALLPVGYKKLQARKRAGGAA